MKFTDSVRSCHVPETPFTWAWPPSLPSVPTSRATRVTSSAKDPSWSTMVLIVDLSWRISPLASTVIFWDRSPPATAVVTWAMLRTWLVRLPASWLTLSVRSFHVPRDAPHLGLAAELALGAHLAGHPGDLVGEGRELVDHGVDRRLELEDLAPGVDGDLLGEVAPGHRGGDLGDVAHLAGEVAGQLVDVVGEGLPRAAHAGHVGLTAQPALGAHLAGHPGDLVGEGPQGVGHGVDGLGQGGHLALGLDRDLLGEVAPGHGGRHLGDVADLAGEVAGHEVHRVGEVLPRAGDARHLGLAAELALGAHLPGHAW